MESCRNAAETHWYVLNFVKQFGFSSPQTVVTLFNRGERRVELFAPTIKQASTVNGKVVFKEKPLTYHYVFVRGRLDDIKALCTTHSNGFSFVLDRSSANRYGIVSNEAMESFMQIARHFDNTLPFYNIEDIDLEEGDLVEIVDGPYAGLKGIYMPKPRSTKGNLVIAATAMLGSMVWNIDAKYVRILKFAKNTRRQYDLPDAFVTRLFPILRKYHAGERLTDAEKSLLTVFCRRMDSVTLDNRKLEAKLTAILMCVQIILGDREGHSRSYVRYKQCMSAVTNIWTLALIHLLLGVSENASMRLVEGNKLIEKQQGKLSESQKQIIEEYHYYQQLNG